MNNLLTKCEVLRSSIVVVTWDGILKRIQAWSGNRESRYVCLCNVHVVATAWCDSIYQRIINHADLATADGMPIVWFLRLKGIPGQERINGPDLMWRLCEMAAQKEVSVFFYGSTPNTLENLSSNLKSQFPTLKIVGAYSPPFRPLTFGEDQEITRQINDSGAGLVFVGLGCPKQEIWMADHRGKVNSVMLGVGAAFDFHAGSVKRAPIWMQKHGLEWFFRLIQEPRRMWWRYTKSNSIFIWMALKELLSSNKWERK